MAAVAFDTPRGGALALLGSSVLTGMTVTTNQPVINVSQTWNNAGVTFVASRVNITDTASGSGSFLFQGTVNGTDQFWVLKGGSIRTIGSLNLLDPAGAPNVTWGPAQDVKLTRDGAGTLALRNGTAAQTFNVYNTYTDASNYERGVLSFGVSANTLFVGTQAAGTGTGRTLALGTNGLGRWSVDGPNGHFTANIDNTYDIGASGANRPRSIYAGTTIASGGNVSSVSGFQNATAASFYWNNRSNIGSPADGNISLTNAAGTSFGLLQFGGTTSSFPAIKRSAAGLQFRTSDDSAFAEVNALQYYVNGASLIASGGSGIIRLTDVATTGFTGLLLGPSGTSYVRLKPDGAGGLGVRLADDSAKAALLAATLTVDGNVQSTGGAIIAGTVVKTQVTTVTGLGSASTAGAGARSFVTDATATTFLSIVAGGGANKVPVVSDGTNWLIG